MNDTSPFPSSPFGPDVAMAVARLMVDLAETRRAAEERGAVAEVEAVQRLEIAVVAAEADEARRRGGVH